MDFNGLIEDFKKQCEKLVQAFQRDLGHIRQGSVDLEAVKNIDVQAYEGVYNKLYQVASINVINALSVLVSPWDKNITKKLEQSIKEVFPHVSLVTKDNGIYVNFPPLTEENLKAVIKQLKDLTEQYRQSLRRVRNKVKSQLDDAKNAEEISDEQYHKYVETLDKETKKQRELIETLAENKEKNILGK